jgi:phosphatidylglycerol---prolipoprotein diacylglyceryl transferase
MVYLDPSSIAFSIGPLAVRWYGLFAAIIFAATYAVVPYLAKRRFGDDDESFWQNVVVVALVSGIIGSRIVHVAILWEYYAANPLDAFKIWQGGLTTHGALIGGILGLWWYARRHKRHLLDLTDTVGVPFIFGLALGRVGNIMNQEIMGRPCPGPWPGCGLSFEWGNDPTGASIARHPVQLYAILKNLITGSIVTALYFKTRTRGIVTAAWIAVYGTLRFIVEFYRDEPLVLGPLDLVQIFTLPLIIASMLWLAMLLVQERRVEEGEPDAS